MEEKSFIDIIDGVVNAISGVLYEPYIVPLILLLGGLILTIFLQSLQLLHLKTTRHSARKAKILYTLQKPAA